MSRSNSESVIRVRPFQYLHIKDTNANIVRVVTGPKTITCQQHEQVVFGPEKMVVIPPRHWVVVENPVIKKKQIDPSTKEEVEIVVTDEFGQALLRHGDKEIRLEQQPFPLYDGEKCGLVQPLQVVEKDTALRLRAIRNFRDIYAKGKHRKTGEEWLFYGRATYYPQVDVEIVKIVQSIILKQDQALRVAALEDMEDHEGNKRKAGEEWLVRFLGAYLPNVTENVIEVPPVYVLTDKKALHVRAKTTFVDFQKIERKAGTKWLITNENSEIYIPDVHEEVISEVALTVLSSNDYCIIRDYVDETGIPKLGYRKLLRGQCSFFLKPGELLEGRIRHSVLLGPEDALCLTATEAFEEKLNNGRKKKRQPGDFWFHYGPGEYWPPLQVQVKYRTTALLKIDSLNFYIFHPSRYFLLLFLWFFFYYFVWGSFLGGPTKEGL